MNELQTKYKTEIEELVEACHRCAALGYVTSSGGNLSYRLEENLILITPTKTPKRQMRYEDICFLCTKYSNQHKKRNSDVVGNDLCVVPLALCHVGGAAQ